MSVRADAIARFFVAGRPRTKGHMQPMPHRRSNGKLAITLHDRDEAREWLQTLIKGIREQVGIVPIIKGRKVVGVEPPWPYVGPVRVDSAFYFDRELSVRDGELTNLPIPSHQTPWPTAKDLGDRDTLERCLLDALTQSGLLEDDRWVVRGEPIKRWSGDGFSPRAGVWCEVWPT